MNLYFRFLWMIVAALFTSKKIKGFDPSVLEYWVMPTDLDPNLHMTNARYYSFMDLGRVDWIIRSKVYKTMLKKGWFPVVGHCYMHFRKPLAPFQKFRITTTVVGWDERWFYMKQHFTIGNKDAATGYIKGQFRDAEGVVNPSEIAELVDVHEGIPDHPVQDGLKHIQELLKSPKV